MSEKTEAEEFDDEDVEELLEGGDEDVDLDRVNKDLDLAKRRSKASGDPAWRRLERLREDQHFADLVSDLEDFDVDDTMTLRRQ